MAGFVCFTKKPCCIGKEAKAFSSKNLHVNSVVALRVPVLHVATRRLVWKYSLLKGACQGAY
jgi:hypothetical protein